MAQRGFGRLPDGREATLYPLRAGQVEVDVTDYGCVIQSIRVPDREGRLGDVVFGFDTVEEYVKHNSHIGCVVGRYANRIAGARFSLDGVIHRLAPNDGVNSLHGGVNGFGKVLWETERVTPSSARFTYLSRNGEEGYPGNLQASVEYWLSPEGELSISYEAETDKATVLNLTNHSYINLAGAGTILNHMVTIDADRYTPVGDGLIPTGKMMLVEETPLDLRVPTQVAARIHSDHPQIKQAGGFDHNYILNGTPGKLRPAATARDPASGRILSVYTTQPGLQFYTGNMLSGRHTGKGGWIYGKHSGLCFETQHYPDSPNQPRFPSTVLRPGERYRERTVFRFSVESKR